MRRDKAFAIAACAVLTAYNNVLGGRRWHSRHYVRVNACACVAALSAGVASGLTITDVGLRHDPGSPGRPGSELAAAVIAAWLLVALVPATRPLLDDKRITSLDGRAVAYQAVVRIPAGTVLWEETAFRGVLQAALRRILPEGAAIAVTSGVFGLWHIRPTAAALRVNGLAGDRGRLVAGVSAGVALTTAGGALLSWLRVRSGSLAAPMALHLAVNSGALMAAWAAASRLPWKGQPGRAWRPGRTRQAGLVSRPGRPPVTMQPQDPAARCAAGRGHLRASDADRERVIDALKTAFVQGRLSRNELGRRAGQALVSRTYADLAGATAGIPAGSAAPSPPRRSAPPSRRGPVNRKVIAWGLAVLITSPGLGVAFVATYYGGFIIFLVLAFILATVTGPRGAPGDGRRGVL